MAGERKEGHGREVVTVIPFARVADANPVDPFAVTEWMKMMPNVPLPPMMAHPAAAVATATALGFGLSSHIAGIMFGVMRGAASVLQKGVVEREPLRPAEPTAAAPAEPAEAKSSRAPVPPATAPKPKAARKQAASAPIKPAEAKSSPAPVPPATAPKPKVAKKPVASAPRSKPTDDLKRISGIGPKLEQVLNGRGIRRIADVAALSAADVARLDAEFGLDGRIARDDWVGQAKALMKEK